MAILAQLFTTDTTIMGTAVYGKVYILLTDPVNGDPVNGGNSFTVDYDIEVNDVLTHYTSVNIPGQSLEIYDGELDDPGVDPHFRTLFTIIAQNDDGNPTPPPVGVCDLLLQNIVVLANESGIGANDASIQVNATSSYGPIEYSLDNVTFQTDPIFTGLSGGSKTVYLQDSNPAGCTNEGQITIPINTNLLLTDPSVTLGSNKSRWNAAFNPIVFTYQRKDFEVSSVALYNISGVTGTNLVINGDMSVLIVLYSANLLAGVNATPIYVYVNAGPYIGLFKVINARPGGQIAINATFTVTATGFMNSNDIKPYYKMITQIQCVDPVTGVPFVFESFNRPNGTGLIKADLSTLLQSLLKIKDASTYSVINFRDDNLSASYRIAYAESWDDGSAAGYTAPFVQLSPTYYVTYTARQLGQKYGGNMADFVPFKNLAAKWVNDFEAPVYSNGYPWDIGFIYGEDLAGLQLYYKLTKLDINKNVLDSGSPITGFLLNEDGSYLLNTDGSRLIIAEATIENVPIVEHVGLNRLLIDYDFDDEVYYFILGIYYDNTGDSAHVTMDMTETQPDFIDGNIQGKNLTTGVYYDLFTNGSVDFDLTAGNNYQFEGYAEVTSGIANAKIRMTITRTIAGTPVVIFDKQIPQIAGADMIKTGIAQPGAIYTAHLQTLATTTPVTTIDIADDAPVTGGAVQVLSDQLVKVDKDCDYNSVYLRWIGLTGSWNYYRFIYNQPLTLDVQNATIIQRNVRDWENDESIEDVIIKAAGEKVQVFNDAMPIDEIRGCQSMKYSPKVQILASNSPFMPKSDDIKWQTIIVNTATFSEFETLLETYAFSVTFNLPSRNIQSQ